MVNIVIIGNTSNCDFDILSSNLNIHPFSFYFSLEKRKLGIGIKRV